MKNLIEQMSKAKNEKRQFQIYMDSSFAISELEYFLLEATTRFRDYNIELSELQKVRQAILSRENGVLRDRVLKSVQEKIKNFIFLCSKFPKLYLYATQVSILFLKEDAVINAIWQQGSMSSSKDLNSLLWPKKIHRKRAEALGFTEYVAILEIQSILTRVNALNQKSSAEIVKSLYDVDGSAVGKEAKVFIERQKKNLIKRLSASKDCLNVHFAKAKPASRSLAIEVFINTDKKFASISNRHVENRLSEFTKKLLLDDLFKEHKEKRNFQIPILFIYYKKYWDEFAKNHSRPSSTKSWNGISI